MKLRGAKGRSGAKEGAAVFPPLFFFIWRGSVKAVEGRGGEGGGRDKPQKTTARVVAVTDYAVPQRFTVCRIKGGGGEGGKKERWPDREDPFRSGLAPGPTVVGT